MELKIALKDLKKHTWAEVQKHNTRADCWVVIEKEVEGKRRGLVLDLTEWAPKHPGGSVIYDGAGGDCTVPFWTYHPLKFVDNSNSYFNKLVIGEIEDYKCMYDIDTKFMRTLKTRVETAVPRTERRGGWAMWFKTLVILTCVAIFYKYGWMTGNLPIIALFGTAVSQIGINMMHDAIHYSYHTNPFISSLAAYAMNLAGANYVSYRRAHVFGHHVYTNHDELDSALLRPFPTLKLHDRLHPKFFHAFQHIYMGLVYCLGAFQFWVGDLQEVRSLYNYPKRRGPLTYRQLSVLILGKLFFCYWCFVLPFRWFPATTAILNIVVFEALLGVNIVTAFAVNHWTDKAALVTNKELLSTTQDWATIQVLTSCNFATHSKLWAQISGGVNYQIEHHLFPSFVNTRLHAIAPIVREVCLEFGVSYDSQCFPSFWDAVASNISFIKRVGTQTYTQPAVYDVITGSKIKHA